MRCFGGRRYSAAEGGGRGGEGQREGGTKGEGDQRGGGTKGEGDQRRGGPKGGPRNGRLGSISESSAVQTSVDR